MRIYWIGALAIFLATPCLGQQTPEIFAQTPGPNGEGWRGFSDLGFLFFAMLDLALAAFLGAVIAYHPRHLQMGESLDGIEAEQIYILYSVIGAMAGILVVQYGMAVGFVLFGIGALIRFRTILRSASQTGRLIFVTLIGLSTGLDLPHVAITVTLFGFLLIFLLEARVTFRIDIRGLSPERFMSAVESYRESLEQERCRIISEKKYPGRGRVIFVIRCSSSRTRQCVEASFRDNVNGTFGGSVNWEFG